MKRQMKMKRIQNSNVFQIKVTIMHNAGNQY